MKMMLTSKFSQYFLNTEMKQNRMYITKTLNPLSNLLNYTKYGYNITGTHPHKITHLLYMDDLKLLVATKQQLNQLLKITETFSKDINMTFGIDKCKINSIVKGRQTKQEDYSLEDNSDHIAAMGRTDDYKYLGYRQKIGIENTNIKEELKQKYKQRLITILKTELTARNKTKAINTNIHKAITHINTSATPLQFHNQTYNPLDNITATHTKKTNWKQKTLHGKHLNQLMQPHIDYEASNTWLRKGNIYGETEGFMVAIQDQVIKTRYYSKHIIKDPSTATDKCRLCKQQIETIDHIITGCTTLANTEYTRRHNNIAKIIHQQLSKQHKLTSQNIPTHKYTAKYTRKQRIQTVLEQKCYN
ncbi:hypothetical protein RN001_008051 [Aquatica leii]|uniref:Reverse transcriptase domain-containing protein n=1 Tax=Aquatica leii TaxID=1421715 RepID=A0AAN7Q4U1_9COLE|nr:hypothetical protein RN001_008051 [Aquatica leii]